MEKGIFFEDISVHDKYRFEIKINLSDDYDGEHIFEYYFFLPSSLNISYFTYSKEQFYSSIQKYLRYSAPNMSIAELFNPSNENSPYIRILKIFDEIKEKNNIYLEETLIDEIKMMASVIKDRITDVVNNDQLDYAISEIIFIKSAVFEAFSNLIKKTTSFKFSQHLTNSLYNADDYINLILIEAVAKILNKNKNIQPVLISSLLRVADELYRYRKSQGYFYPDEKDSEYFLYYRGVLKKFISSCLFLNTEPAFNIYHHIASSIASAVAMLFAVVVTLYAQQKYSLTSVVFMVIAVISYVFKDRIKEFSKFLFIKKAGKIIYDRKVKITEPVHGFDIGYVKEAFFIMFPNNVDLDVLIKRKEMGTGINEIAPETVLKYKKIVKINSKKIKMHHKRRHRLVDIMRFSIYDFLRHSDDESLKYYVYSDGMFKVNNLSKNYILNFVVRCLHKDAGVFYEKYRIVFNRSGIIKVEKV